ncbi:MAG: hypothetical protein HFG20_06705 [Anaerotruncus sp.]|nr:hypothetical protein [Anaerotruncus sp.]
MITLLRTLQDRLQAAVFGGIQLLADDFRLHRAAEQLKGICDAAPVLERLNALVQPLCKPDCPDKPAQLLDALALVNAILCTQADFAAPAPTAPLPVLASGPAQPFPASLLEPVRQALSQRGSRRLALVEKASHQSPELLRDFRLRQSILHALADPALHSLAQQALLQTYHAPLLLKRGFDPKGKAEMVHRIDLIGQLAGAAENQFYLSLLKGASAQVRDMALRQLRFDPQNTELLLQLAKKHTGKALISIYYALSFIGTAQARAYLLNLARYEPETALPFLTPDCSDESSDQIAAQMEELLSRLLHGDWQPCQIPAGYGKNAWSSSELQYRVPLELCNQASLLFAAAFHKSSPRMLETLSHYATHSQELFRLINDNNYHPILFSELDRSLCLCHPCKERSFHLQWLDYQPIVQCNYLLIAGMLAHPQGRFLEMTNTLYERHGVLFLAAQFAALLLTDPMHAFDRLQPLFEDVRAQQMILLTAWLIGYGDTRLPSSPGLEGTEGQYFLTITADLIPGFERRRYARCIGKRFDIRWLKEFLAHYKERWSDLYCGNQATHFFTHIVNPDDAESLELLREFNRKQAVAAQGACPWFGYLLCGGDHPALQAKYPILKKYPQVLKTLWPNFCHVC